MLFFFFNDTAPTEIYTLSLHDALPILRLGGAHGRSRPRGHRGRGAPPFRGGLSLAVRGAPAARRIPAPPVVGHSISRTLRESDRKSTRLNSSHANISYAVFCLKKKNNT